MSRYHRFESFKIMAHSDRIKAIVDGHIPAPVEWVIYPSNACGYKCGHCIMAEEKDSHPQRLPEETMRKIPFDARAHGIKTVIFSGGGDPLLNPWTLDTARELRARGIKTGINNQGWHLTDASMFNYVRFSVDAATKETYQKIHGIDGWERINDNIRNLKKSPDTEVGLAFLVTPTNWHEIESFCEWGQQFDPEYLHIRPAFLDAPYLDLQYPGGDADLRHRVPEMIEMQRRIEVKYKNVFFRIDKFDGYWTPKLYGKCRSTPLLAVLAADGSFLICQDKFMRWGDYNTQSFNEIWWGDEHRKIIEAIDLKTCPRCVENGYNEIIEHVFVEDGLRRDLI